MKVLALVLFLALAHVVVTKKTSTLGGYNDVSVKDKEVKDAASYCFKYLQKHEASVKGYKVLVVNKAQLQIVSHQVNYKLKLTLKSASAKKNKEVDVKISKVGKKWSVDKYTMKTAQC